jgi:hypothetical protein
MGNPWKGPCAETAEVDLWRGNLADDLVKRASQSEKKNQRSAKCAISCGAYEAGRAVARFFQFD